MDLDEMMVEIRKLVKEKGHEDTFSDDVILKKGVFAMIELAEALDEVKKHGCEVIKIDRFLRNHVGEELIDVLFYILDMYGIFYNNTQLMSPSDMFMSKLNKNLAREKGYGRPGKKEVPVDQSDNSKYSISNSHGDVPVTC